MFFMGLEKGRQMSVKHGPLSNYHDGMGLASPVRFSEFFCQNLGVFNSEQGAVPKNRPTLLDNAANVRALKGEKLASSNPLYPSLRQPEHAVIRFRGLTIASRLYPYRKTRGRKVLSREQAPSLPNKVRTIDGRRLTRCG
jgi:hypothetical protein